MSRWSSTPSARASCPSRHDRPPDPSRLPLRPPVQAKCPEGAGCLRPATEADFSTHSHTVTAPFGGRLSGHPARSGQAVAGSASDDDRPRRSGALRLPNTGRQLHLRQARSTPTQRWQHSTNQSPWRVGSWLAAPRPPWSTREAQQCRPRHAPTRPFEAGRYRPVPTWTVDPALTRNRASSRLGTGATTWSNGNCLADRARPDERAPARRSGSSARSGATGNTDGLFDRHRSVPRHGRSHSKGHPRYACCYSARGHAPRPHRGPGQPGDRRRPQGLVPSGSVRPAGPLHRGIGT